MTWMKRFSMPAVLGVVLFAAAPAAATTFDLSGSQSIETAGQITIIIDFGIAGVGPAPTGFQGYGLDIFYDTGALSFNSVTQLATDELFPGFTVEASWFANPVATALGLPPGCTGLVSSNCGTAAIAPLVPPAEYRNDTPANFPAPTGNPLGLFMLVFDKTGGPANGTGLDGFWISVGIFGDFSGVAFTGGDDFNGRFDWPSGPPVPEPSTILLLGLGLAGIVGTALRRRS